MSNMPIASPKGAKQSLAKKLRLSRRYAPRNENLLYEIATLPSVARNDTSIFNIITESVPNYWA